MTNIHVIIKNKRHLAVFAAVLVFVATVLIGSFIFIKSKKANATLSGFSAGNIIDNATMSNKDSMSEAQIQSWLSSKNSCNNNNYANYVKYTAKGYTYIWVGAANDTGHFACISEEKFDSSGLPTSGDGQTAAQIIYQAAQDYDINPQVLIVLIQKESGLITDTWPNAGQYKSATGYDCPDTGACNGSFGFIAQVRSAANLFHTVLTGGWTNYPVGSDYVLYNSNTSCGGSVITIQNLATSALYRYTPYQPNTAALAAGYGTGDSCSAYGNRNFYNYFTDWFGSTRVEGAAGLMGNVDYATYDSSTKLISVAGWSFDYANTSTYNAVDMYVGGEAGSNFAVASKRMLAWQPSSDVSSVFGISGNHRFADTISYDNSCGGSVPVYFYAIGLGDYHRLLDTKIVSTPAAQNCVYRLYNPVSGDHFYTTSILERNSAANSGYTYEGIAFDVSGDSNPVYRLYNYKTGEHFYTTSTSERDSAMKNSGFSLEGVAYSISGSSNTPIYRLVQARYPYMHFYTSSTVERDSIVKSGDWRYEGIAWDL